MWVKIETIHDGKPFVMEIESNGLLAFNCLWGKNVEFLDEICEICIADDIILVRTQDRDFRDGRQTAPILKDERKENNVNAFDWQGNHLWNIGELIGDIKMQIDGIVYITPTTAKAYGIRLKRKERYLFGCISGGFVFIIDAKNKKLLYKISGKVK